MDGDYYFPGYDNNGNVIGYWHEEGDLVAEYAYDAFGNTIYEDGDMADFFPHRFSTKYYDAEADLYYYGYRYYSPSLGRWISRDPIGEDDAMNLFLFCGNGTPYSVDHLGMFAIYVHTHLLGHVGLATEDGVYFDYGRYHHSYTGGTAKTGPNILRKADAQTALKGHTFYLFHFDVCKELDDEIASVFETAFNNGEASLPAHVRSKYEKDPGELESNKRYMGTDWSLSDNCQHFTITELQVAVSNYVKKKGHVGKKDRVLLQYLRATQHRLWPRGIKSDLEIMSVNWPWITKWLHIDSSGE